MQEGHQGTQDYISKLMKIDKLCKKIKRVPPPLYSIPMRPILLDTAFNYIEAPNIEHRLPKETMIGKLWNLAGWGK